MVQVELYVAVHAAAAMCHHEQHVALGTDSCCCPADVDVARLNWSGSTCKTSRSYTPLRATTITINGKKLTLLVVEGHTRFILQHVHTMYVTFAGAQHEQKVVRDNARVQGSEYFVIDRAGAMCFEHTVFDFSCISTITSC